MDMLRHHHVPHDYETIALPAFFQDLNKQIATVCTGQSVLAMIATTGDEMQMAVTVVAAQAFRHGNRLER